MRAYSLVLMLVASALSAPQNGVSEEGVKSAKEVSKEAGVGPQARSLLHGAIPYNAPGYTTAGYRATPLVVPQFGARLATPYQQYNQYQPQYYQGQQHGYYPAQGYIHSSPYYQNSAFYQGASGLYPQPQIYSALTAAKKSTVVKPLVPVHHEAERFSSVVSAPVAAPLATPVVRAHAIPVPAPVFKAAEPTVKAAVYPGHPEPFHAIVRQSHDDNFDGSFTYSYETDHGVAVESSGFLKNAGTPDQVQVMQGSYTYYTPEGIPITTTYIADENGFQVQGDHLPQPPEMPEAIAKSIAYQRSLPPSEEDLIEQQRAKIVDAKLYTKYY